MVKHNKLRNVGVLFESLNKSVVYNVNEKNDVSNKLLKVIKDFYMQNTNISEAYKLYSQVLYGSAIGENQANSFMNELVNEAVKLNYSKIDKEINVMLKNIDKIVDHKKMLKEKVENYKLFASFKCLVDNKMGKLSMTPLEKMNCEKVVIRHLTENKENDKLKKSSEMLNSVKYDEDKSSTENLALVIAYDEFAKKYSNTLLKEQSEFLEKYLTTSSDKSYKRWTEKKIEKILKEIEDKKEFIEDDNICDKLELVESKLKNVINQDITEESLYTILKTLELKKNLEMF